MKKGKCRNFYKKSYLSLDEISRILYAMIKKLDAS
jgi:hypothetical protein